MIGNIQSLIGLPMYSVPINTKVKFDSYLYLSCGVQLDYIKFVSDLPQVSVLLKELKLPS
jgi:hypothetical protein